MTRPRLADVILGCAAGAIGTIAMDTLWWRRARRSGSDDRMLDWEFAAGSDFASFEAAGAPAQVGQRLARIAGVELPVERAGLTTDIVHWATGVSWGGAAGVLAATTRIGAFPAGVASGMGAVSTAYAGLGAAGIYPPVWEYDRSTLWDDVSAHLVFGVATGLALRAFRSHTRGS